MLFHQFADYSDQLPEWFLPILDIRDHNLSNNQRLEFVDDILRSSSVVSERQKQTEEVFGYKWHKVNTFESDASQDLMREWSNDRYGNIRNWIKPTGLPFVVLDAGCGASHTAKLYFEPVLKEINYVGVDISNAVDVAKQRMQNADANAVFMQCDLQQLPFLNETFDLIFSEGVLHHTDSTEKAFFSLIPYLKQNGLFMFYVYKKKGPIREFTDDFVREKLQGISQEDAWKLVEGITSLGKLLGELDIQVEIPQPIELLGIEPGKIDIQRLFYWHVLKCFYRPDFSFEEMNHINFDWFAPKNAFRQTPEEVREWCDAAGLMIEREVVEDAGITIVARKIGAN